MEITIEHEIIAEQTIRLYKQACNIKDYQKAMSEIRLAIGGIIGLDSVHRCPPKAIEKLRDILNLAH